MGWFFPKIFKKIPNITKYQHFRLTKDKPCIVYVHESWNSEEKEIKLLKHGKTVTAVKRARIPAVILLDKR